VPARPRRSRRPSIPKLDEAERLLVIDTFTTLVEGLYTHLPLKRSMYGSDPVQRLRLLRRRVGLLDDMSFHNELASIVTGLRDAHTRYVGPSSLAGRAAMLPFLVESYGPAARPRYIVSKVASDPSLVGDDQFVPGVELRWWNAVPIDRAVDLHAEQETGGRPDSRRARALETLTLRALQFGPPPDEHWVVVGYTDLEGNERDVRVDWRVVSPRKARTASNAASLGWRHYAIDPAAETARRVKKLLFAPHLWLSDHAPVASRRRGSPATAAAPSAAGGEWIDTEYQDTLAAREVTTRSGRFGYLRLWSFDVSDDVPFVEEVVRLLGLLPDRGLVVDLRANPGGLISAAERLLQLFGPQRIVPTRFSLLATPLTREMAAAPQNAGDLDAWSESLDDAVATGELYSKAVPMTPAERCNDIGQVYGGPVVAVVDANTYSAGDLFAAGFVDNDLGLLVTVGQATGAGGANVWMPDDVNDALLGTRFEQPVLPAGIGYTISVRRATRSLTADGMAIEDVGVRGHRVHAMTRRDLVDGNRDLLNHCGRLLASQPRTQLTLTDAADRVEVTTLGLDRLDLFVDDRPFSSRPVSHGTTTVDVPDEWTAIDAAGYAGSLVRQRRRLRR
jgi:hypothetical protein